MNSQAVDGLQQPQLKIFNINRVGPDHNHDTQDVRQINNTVKTNSNSVSVSTDVIMRNEQNQEQPNEDELKSADGKSTNKKRTHLERIGSQEQVDGKNIDDEEAEADVEDPSKRGDGGIKHLKVDETVPPPVEEQ